ncbi:MAG TPA: type IX secretion system outer membrane channel protein PorV [Bacteroidales bacterium]
MRGFTIKFAFILLSLAIFFPSFHVSAQTPNALGSITKSINLTSTSVSAQTPNALGQELKVIQTAVPFLMIAPDARAGAMGDAGVSSSPDANSMHWNPAKLAFIDKEMGFSVSYSPWLRKLVPDISLAYLSGYKRIDDKQVFGMSLLYFSLGNITFTADDGVGTPIGTYRPNEFSLDASYARKFSENISGAVSARYIHSNLTQGQYVGGASTKPGNSIAADVSVYSSNPVTFNNTEGIFAWGINISNIGSKISYSNDNTEKDFIPTNLRFGPSLTLNLDEYNKMTFMIDFNKLLVPTPPIYAIDSSGNPIVDAQNNQIILKGKNPKVSVPLGMLQSFYDAPNGFGEEMSEFSIATGIEYWYDKQFAVRLGYFYEDKNKGNRKFFSAGLGLKYNVFGLDFSYLIPMEQQNPLESTLRFSLLFDFDAFQDQNKKK